MMLNVEEVKKDQIKAKRREKKHALKKIEQFRK